MKSILTISILFNNRWRRHLAAFPYSASAGCPREGVKIQAQVVTPYAKNSCGFVSIWCIVHLGFSWRNTKCCQGHIIVAHVLFLSAGGHLHLCRRWHLVQQKGLFSALESPLCYLLTNYANVAQLNYTKLLIVLFCSSLLTLLCDSSTTLSGTHLSGRNRLFISDAGHSGRMVPSGWYWV